MTHSSIPFIDLAAQQEKIRTNLEKAMLKVLDHGHYIMGPEVEELEEALSDFCGAKHVISCSNGTDALAMGLMAYGMGPGDAIFVPSFTFAATAEVVAWCGATPIFIDSLDTTFNMDPKNLEAGIQKAKKEGLSPKGIVPVDLFGLPADYDAILPIAEKNNLWVMCDAAQSFGASYKGKRVGTIGNLTTTSFFPAKPLGCYGDGGAIFTDDAALAEKLRSIRVHGKGSDKYDNVRIGLNGRLDTLQAAILLEKLKVFPDELQARQETADFYTEHLKGCVQVPHLPAESRSAWAQYTVVLPDPIDRNDLMRRLKEEGVPTVVYYVKPLHLQTAYKNFPTATDGGLPVSERLSHRVLSLPMSGYVSKTARESVVAHFKKTISTL